LFFSLVCPFLRTHRAPKTPSANGVGQPSSVGIDVDAAALADMAALNVWDHLLAKRNAIQLAVDAALTILKARSFDCFAVTLIHDLTN
jgi:chaperonin GroEL (HSP60 family)